MGVISVNGEPWREMAASLFKKNPFQTTYETMEAWEHAWNEWEGKQAKLIAYDKLSRKRYFERELKTALERYGFGQACIRATIEQIAALGYLNDAEGVEALVNRGIRQKKSPSWIKNKLREKGVESEIDYPREVRESVIRALLLKNKKGKKGLISIARKGFSYEEIVRIQRELDYSMLF